MNGTVLDSDEDCPLVTAAALRRRCGGIGGGGAAGL